MRKLPNAGLLLRNRSIDIKEARTITKAMNRRITNGKLSEEQSRAMIKEHINKLYVTYLIIDAKT